MRSQHVQSLVVRAWGALYVWSRRHYERERFREELGRIGRRMAAERQTGPVGVCDFRAPSETQKRWVGWKKRPWRDTNTPGPFSAGRRGE